MAEARRIEQDPLDKFLNTKDFLQCLDEEKYEYQQMLNKTEWEFLLKNYININVKDICNSNRFTKILQDLLKITKNNFCYNSQKKIIYFLCNEQLYLNQHAKLYGLDGARKNIELYKGFIEKFNWFFEKDNNVDYILQSILNNIRMISTAERANLEKYIQTKTQEILDSLNSTPGNTMASMFNGARSTNEEPPPKRSKPS